MILTRKIMVFSTKKWKACLLRCISVNETLAFEELQQRVMRKNVWNYFFFTSFGVVALWLILKAFWAI